MNPEGFAFIMLNNGVVIVSDGIHGVRFLALDSAQRVIMEVSTVKPSYSVLDKNINSQSYALKNQK